jgi:hypothetical protein
LPPPRLPTASFAAQEKLLLDELAVADGSLSLDEYATALEKMLHEKRRLAHGVQAPPPPPPRCTPHGVARAASRTRLLCAHLSPSYGASPFPVWQVRLDALKAQLSNEEALSARVKQLPIY